MRVQHLWHRGLNASCHVDSSWTRDQTHVPCIGRQTLIHSTTREVWHCHFSRYMSNPCPHSCSDSPLISHRVLRGFSSGSDGKESACSAGTRVRSWAGNIPWRRSWQSAPVFLPRESYGQRSLVGYSPWGHKEADMTERPTFC